MGLKKETNAYVLIVAAVAVVAIVSLVLNGGNLEGAPVIVAEENRLDKCFDNDEANDFYTYGYAQLGLVKYADECVGDSVVQYYCERGDNVLKLAPFNCPNGCQSGQCLR